MDLFLFKCHACISHKTAKYLQNPRFSRKVHHNSPIEGTKISNLYRLIELDELYRIDSFLLKYHACISPKTAKYLQNPRFSRKLHHDLPIEGTKTSNLHRPIELDKLYRMVMTSFRLNHWIPSERANPRRNAEFFFREGAVFLKNMKIALAGPFSEEYYMTEETSEKCVMHIFFGLCCFPFISQRTRSKRHHSIYYFITFGGISGYASMEFE